MDIGSADRFEKLKFLMERGYYDSVVKESCALLEEVLKAVYKQALSDLPISDRTALMESEGKIGNNTKSFTQFGFGELVGLFNRSRLLDRWSKYTVNNMGIIRSISLDYIVELRNKLTHNQSAMTEPVSRSEAQLVYDCLFNWLSFIGYKDMTKGVEKAFEAEKAAEEKVSNYQRMKQETRSDYDSATRPEKKRLRRQETYSRAHDAGSFAYALERMGNPQGLVGLDVGCADGYVTERRFLPEYGFAKVVGVDKNQELIDKVRQEDHGIFHYHYMDIESRNLDDDMEDLLEEEGVERFDLIYCALTLHHLKNPKRLLIKLRKYLRTGGALIIRGVDDGGMIAYDDGGLVEKILEDCLRLKNMSDRFHGRKFYPWLREVGFTDIRMRYLVDDTTTMDSEEREDFFQYYFAFRLQYVLRNLERNPDDPELKSLFDRMQDNLDRLEELFAKPDFFFSTMTVTAVAIKT